MKSEQSQAEKWLLHFETDLYRNTLFSVCRCEYVVPVLSEEERGIFAETKASIQQWAQRDNDTAPRSRNEALAIFGLPTDLPYDFSDIRESWHRIMDLYKKSKDEGYRLSDEEFEKYHYSDINIRRIKSYFLAYEFLNKIIVEPDQGNQPLPDLAQKILSALDSFGLEITIFDDLEGAKKTIKKSYHEQSVKLHPDKFTSTSTDPQKMLEEKLEQEAKFVKLRPYYDFLMDNVVTKLKEADVEMKDALFILLNRLRNQQERQAKSTMQSVNTQETQQRCC